VSRFAVALTAILVGATAACRGGGGGEGRRFLSIGTAGTGGIYYPLGGAIASVLSDADTLHRYTAEVTGGSVENLNRIANGEIDLGFSIGTSVYEAYHGGDNFPVPLSKLRVIAPLYPNVTHILIAAGFGGASPEEFRGRRVSVGAPGSGTEQVARQLLNVYGLGYDDVDVRYLSFRESSDALRDGAIDAAIFSVGYPASAVLEATTAGGVRLLGLDSDHRTTLANHYPYYEPATIPAGAYPRVDRPVPTVSVMNWVVGTKDLEADVVRYVLTALRTDRQRLVRVHDIARQIDLRALDRTPVPLHGETARWWAEEQERVGATGSDP
jgi:TRAP transporter TAXI family solute receptor